MQCTFTVVIGKCHSTNKSREGLRNDATAEQRSVTGSAEWRAVSTIRVPASESLNRFETDLLDLIPTASKDRAVNWGTPTNHRHVGSGSVAALRSASVLPSTQRYDRGALTLA